MNINHRTFNRNSIKSRMLKTASENFGYENFELDSFDPLVDLLISAFAKEVEKSHLFFDNTFKQLLDQLSDRLIPNKYLDFTPSFGVMHVRPLHKHLLSNENFTCKYSKEIKEEETEIGFVPLLEFPVDNISIKIIHDGNNLFTFNGLEREILTAISSNKNSLYLGIEIDDESDVNSKHPIFFNWFDHPKQDLFKQIISHSQFILDGHEVNVRQGFGSRIEEINSQEFTQILKKYHGIIHLFQDHFFFIDFTRINQPKVPKFIKQKISEKAELAIANNLHWLEIKLPHLDDTVELLEEMYCQVNCVPVINLNQKKLTEKIRQPYSSIRISDSDYFVDVHKIENHLSEEYVPSNSFEDYTDKIAGSYSVSRDGVLRINRENAIEQIQELLDLINEERQVFSTLNPDWIIDELEAINNNIYRIEHKLGDSLLLQPNDVFIKFKDKNKDSIVQVQYLTCNGNHANNINGGTILEIDSSFTFSDDALVVLSTQNGDFKIQKDLKKKKFKFLTESKNRIVTLMDFKKAIEYIAHPINIKDISFQKNVQVSLNPKMGLIPCLNVLITPEQKVENKSLFKRRIEYFIKDKLIANTNYKLEIV